MDFIFDSILLYLTFSLHITRIYKRKLYKEHIRNHENYPTYLHQPYKVDNINFWKDKWIGNFKIKEYVTNIPDHLKDLTVDKLIDWNRRKWELKEIQIHCPKFILNQIHAISIPLFEREDSCRWALNNRGN